MFKFPRLHKIYQTPPNHQGERGFLKRTIIILLAAALVLAGFTSLHRMSNNREHYSESIEIIPAVEYQRMFGLGINVDWMKYSWINYYNFH